jgi:protein phosphatase
MGGYNGGEVASKLAITTARDYILNNYANTEHTKEALLELVVSSSIYANMVVFEKASQNAEIKHMGTTLDICLFFQNNVLISHIGDSRVYRIRNDYMRKLTKDHSYVQQLVDDGSITDEEAAKHPDKNLLMKAIGVNSFIEPDGLIKGYQKGDVFLMCSDGLTNMVSEDEILKIIEDNPTDCTKPLIQKANDNGGHDNITAIVIR